MNTTVLHIGIGVLVALGLTVWFLIVWRRNHRDYREYLEPILASHGVRFVSAEWPGFFNVGPFPKFEVEVGRPQSRVLGFSGEYDVYKIVTFRDSEGRTHEIWANLEFEMFHLRSSADLAAQVRQSGLVASIRPWQHRCWVFPRDPHFAEKAGRILDLYERVWLGRPPKDGEFVLSADEKTSIQARRRRHRTLPPQPGVAMKVEHEYTRCGAWAYLAALDVHRAKLFGRCERKNGIAPFGRLVDQVMTQTPYKEALIVFWILDNGSAHRGARCIRRLQAEYPRIVPVHGPVHASWLNQIEIYFSIVQRKVLTPNDFLSLQALEQRLLGFQQHYATIAKPFKWKFTRHDLSKLMNKLKAAA